MRREYKAFAYLCFAVFALSRGTLSGAASAAGLQGYIRMCAGTKQLCPWYKAVVTPPKGWIEDDAWTQRYQTLVLFENGDKSHKKPIMYLRAHNGNKQLSLEEYIGGAQDRWKKRVGGSSIEPLPDFERKNKPTFKVFLYKNPSVAGQAFELTAFTKDAGAANPRETYFFQAVLSSPSMEEIERTKSAFYELLGNL